MSSSLSPSIVFLFLVALPSLTFALGARVINCNSPSCYPNCCGMGIDKDAEEFVRHSRASANIVNYLMRNRASRSLDMIDAPSFGGSRTFGGFGYNQKYYNTDFKRTGNNQMVPY